MKCFVAVLAVLAVSRANPGVEFASYSYANPAGVTFRGTGFNPGFAIGPAQPVAVAPGPVGYAAAPVAAVPAVAPVPAPLAYAQPQPAYNYQAAPYAHNYLAQAPALQYAAAPAPGFQYAAAPAPGFQYAAAPALAVTQKLGYAHHQVPVQVPGVADVPVTKLAYTHGVTQKLVDVAQPAVTNRRVKVRRPALRKEFYDIEHRVIVRPAGSATLELSQPISKTQKGPAVLTPTNYQQIAPVVRYGTSRQIIDGEGVSSAAQIRANLARGINLNAGPAPAPAPAPQLRSAEPQPQAAPAPAPAAAPEQFQRQVQPQQPEQFQRQIQQQPEQQQQQPEQFQRQIQQQPEQQQQQQPQQPQQQFAAAPAPRLRPLQLRPQGPPQPQPQPQLRSGSDDAEIVEASQDAPQQQQEQPQQPQPAGPHPPQGARLNIQDMPVELQARLLELLSGRGGTVTEVLGENGRPADSASVLQVADALQDINLQGGERITTRRIVVTRPIETEQEVDIQEPATKYHQHLVNTPTLFKTAVQGVARVPVSYQGVKNVATPVLKTHYQPAFAGYAAPAYGYAPAGVAY